MLTSQCKKKKEGKKGDKIRPRMDPFPQTNHTLVTNTVLFKKKKKKSHFPCCVCLLKPLTAQAEGQPGHKPTQAQDEKMEGVHQASLNSTPGACKCTRRHDQHGGRLLLRRWGPVVCCADPLTDGRPWTSTQWNKTVRFAAAETHPCVQMWWCECGCDAGAGFLGSLEK